MEEGLFSLCEGDTSIIHNLLDEELGKGIFEKLRDEVRWQKMSHLGGDVPRLVVVQGDVGEDGSIYQSIDIQRTNHLHYYHFHPQYH